MIQGIDVSKYQGKIDWNKVAASGLVQFAYSKATENATSVDSQFKNNWNGMKDAGIIRGAYHFARTHNDPIKEANHFTTTVGSELLATDSLVLDIEESKLIGPPFINWVLAWLEQVEKTTGKIPIVYTYGPFFDTQDGNPSSEVIDKLLKYPLWLAAYTVNPDKYTPKVWKTVGWTIWQKSGNVAAPGDSILYVPGINGAVDKNVFKGSLEDFKKFVLNLHTPLLGQIGEVFDLIADK